MKKRCICGQSQVFPLCDESHNTANWTCSQSSSSHYETLIIGSNSLRSLVEYLVHHHNYVNGHQLTSSLTCDELIIIYDGSSLNQLLALLNRYPHQRRRVLSIGCPPPFTFNSNHIKVGLYTITSDESRSLKDLHTILRSFLTLPLTYVSSSHLPAQRIFVSHAVQDEELIIPVIDLLRVHYGLTFFLCADSIPIGSTWYEDIEFNLIQSDLVLVLCSSSFNQSTFCGFEMGMARALKRPIYPILLDDSGPPSYIQHLNAIDLKRIKIASPWLSNSDALLHAFFLSFISE